ncbi:MAG: transposase [Candidatus Latescibacteria bacterium]|nr:transposase [Candidatus Latescibacterota bacterium]NIM22189.1 transposase [Candidatus Latescibacterota bacterium]NIM64739.1 transposase [Candidatus Latescibacterota bacterium]NIO01249.1 transposase [Candidatus Latescibacterota bacterium]NIO27634.1 transposase [Candidatus Latescibacterota bacterium]
MRKSRFTEAQIILALRQAEAGTPVAEICRKLEITETTFYRWKKKYGGLGVSELRELRQLREENRKLKQLVADLSLDKHILRESLKKNSKTRGKTEVGNLGSRGIPSFRKAGLAANRGGTVDDAVSFSPTETRAPTETDKGVGNGSHQLWLPPSSCTSPMRRLADQPQAGLSTLQRGRAGAEAKEAQTTEKRDGSSDISDGSQPKRAVGDGFHA